MSIKKGCIGKEKKELQELKKLYKKGIFKSTNGKSGRYLYDRMRTLSKKYSINYN